MLEGGGLIFQSTGNPTGKALWEVAGPVLPYVEACLNRELYPLCLLPGLFPRLGLILGMRETAYGLAVPVLCLQTGQVEEHDPYLLDPVDPG
jgi:hypothetical protein